MLLVFLKIGMGNMCINLLRPITKHFMFDLEAQLIALLPSAMMARTGGYFCYHYLHENSSNLLYQHIVCKFSLVNGDVLFQI